MKDFTEEELAYITRLAAAAFPPHQIAIVMRTDPVLFSEAANETTSKVFEAVNAGFLTRQLELRERIFLDAKNGSSPAQTIASRLMDNFIIKSILK